MASKKSNLPQIDLDAMDQALAAVRRKRAAAVAAAAAVAVAAPTKREQVFKAEDVEFGNRNQQSHLDEQKGTNSTLANTNNDALVNGMKQLKIDRQQHEKREAISYVAERIIGFGSFGTVYQATVVGTGETVAIKKVLQDRRYKNRELDLLLLMHHPTIVELKHCFYSKGDEPGEIYLNLVMEFLPETMYRVIRAHAKANRPMQSLYVKVYMFQILRAVNYIHKATGVCHRDIKPQNLLICTKTHQVKLCDFGSAKRLVPGERNVSYICSRYYRAPELIFEAVHYSCAVDIWSVGCVFAEMLLGSPLFPGESSVDQLISIIKICGTPSKEELSAMNPHHNEFKFPLIKPYSFSKLFRNKASSEAVDLLSRMLCYNPQKRIDPFDALSHPFFDDLRTPNTRLPNGMPLPNVNDWTEFELNLMHQCGLTAKLLSNSH